MNIEYYKNLWAILQNVQDLMLRSPAASSHIPGRMVVGNIWWHFWWWCQGCGASSKGRFVEFLHYLHLGSCFRWFCCHKHFGYLCLLVSCISLHEFCCCLEGAELMLPCRLAPSLGSCLHIYKDRSQGSYWDLFLYKEPTLEKPISENLSLRKKMGATNNTMKPKCILDFRQNALKPSNCRYLKLLSLKVDPAY